MVTCLLLRRAAEGKDEGLQGWLGSEKIILKWNLILTDPYSHQGGFAAHQQHKKDEIGVNYRYNYTMAIH